ncbi:MAG: hypothetical protein NT145_03590 [Elusimicrobia bacterium]|nr:hypothetical protein [Elusimicrobiota bacterium]
MTYEERQKLIEEFTKQRFQLLFNKGKEYSGGNEDVNWNFKEVSKRLGTRLAGTPLFVCLVYLEKHIISLEKWARDGVLSSGEDVHSRLADTKNYLDILESLIIEDKKEV